MLTVNYTKFEELKNKRTTNAEIYKIELEILNNLNLLKKKDGSNYQNPLKMFDIETIKKHFEKKGFKMGSGSCVYLTEDEYNYKINFSLNSISSTLYLKKRVYIDELTKEEQEKITQEKIILGGGWVRKYYNLSTVEEMQKEIEERKEVIKKWLDAENVSIKQLKKVLSLTEKYIKDVNEATKNPFKNYKETSFYKSEIASLIDY